MTRLRLLPVLLRNCIFQVLRSHYSGEFHPSFHLLSRLKKSILFVNPFSLFESCLSRDQATFWLLRASGCSSDTSECFNFLFFFCTAAGTAAHPSFLFPVQRKYLCVSFGCTVMIYAGLIFFLPSRLCFSAGCRGVRWLLCSGMMLVSRNFQLTSVIPNNKNDKRPIALPFGWR